MATAQDLSILLAKLAEESGSADLNSDLFFGLVTAVTAPNFVTVLPDSSADGYQIAGISLLGTTLPSVGNRVACLKTQDGGVSCIGKIV